MICFDGEQERRGNLINLTPSDGDGWAEKMKRTVPLISHGRRAQTLARARLTDLREANSKHCASEAELSRNVRREPYPSLSGQK
jgi:hypothetical protein